MTTSTKKSSAVAGRAKSSAPAKASKAATPSVRPPSKSIPPKAASKSIAPPAKSVPPKAAAKSVAPPAKSVPPKAAGKSVAPPAKSVPPKTAATKPKAASKPKADRPDGDDDESTDSLAPSAAEAAAPAGAGLAKPGAAPRLTVRTPIDADERKQKLGALATATNQIKNLKRGMQRSFVDIGQILNDIDERKLYEVKGYGSFEAFLEREIELGKLMGLRLARVFKVFQREAALAAGLDRVTAALAVLDGEVDPNAVPPSSTPTSSGGARSPIPFHKQ